MDYKGIKCPVCGKPFTENDDIVVCPVCGAPYHRDCYAEKGACIFDELHESGEAWAPPPPPAAPNAAAEIKDKECPVCGVLNAHSALFCNACGASLTGTPQQHVNRTPVDSASPQDPGQTGQAGYTYNPRPSVHGAYGGFPAGMGGVPFAVDPMGGANPMEQIAENVTYGDVSKLVQQNSGYYLSAFRLMNMFRRGKFSVAGFLFSGGWLLYRKQYKAGILVSVLMFLLFISNTLLSYLVINPMVLSAADSLGLSYSEITYVQLTDALLAYLTEHPDQYFIFMLPLVTYLLMLAIMIFVGVRGNKMYMNHCIRTVRKIKSESRTEDELAAAYAERGGVAVSAAVCVFFCYLVVRWIPTFFL